MTRGTTSVYRFRGLIGYKHIRSAVTGAPDAAYHSAELQGAAQDGNSDAVSPLPCTGRQLSEGDGTESYWVSIIAVSDDKHTLSLQSADVNSRDAQYKAMFLRPDYAELRSVRKLA